MIHLHQLCLLHAALCSVCRFSAEENDRDVCTSHEHQYFCKVMSNDNDPTTQTKTDLYPGLHDC